MKKHKTKKELEEEKLNKEILSVPRALVFTRSKRSIGKKLEQLMHDLRKVMLPYTSKKVEVHKKTKLSSLLLISKQIHLTHFVILSITSRGPQIKFIRVPNGPTLSCSIEEYSHMNDLREFMQKLNLHYSAKREIFNKPCIPLFNGFDINVPWINLTKSILENMFPKPDLEKFNIMKDAKRVVMFNMEKETGKIDFRHYEINYNEEKKVQLNEIGPRFSFKVSKIENEVLKGEVLYHAYIKKTQEEMEEMEKRHQKRKKEKQKRKDIQEENVEKKLEKKRKKKIEKRKKKRQRQKEFEEEIASEHTKEEIDKSKKLSKLHQKTKKRKKEKKSGK